ncbi:putative G-protein coupled receptor Mth-like 3 isoform X2 [Anticarsia gemmatalis]|uniref:putative G-protein coupled receptor Mth-like 3 isoform X2 n=1 Tax=Anticarsia gemmatalis TaxID=129554 RepID=UPI003F76B8EF
MWMSMKALSAHVPFTMRFLIIVSAVLYYTSADNIPEDEVFHKCCPKSQSLVKVSEFEDSENIYQCIDRETAQSNYSTPITPLIVGKTITVEYGIPSECYEIQMVQMTALPLDSGLKSLKENCYDRLELEVINGTLKPYVPKLVALSCIKNDTEKSFERNLVNRIRKCCARGQSYDAKFHLCRNSTEDSTEDWILDRLQIGDNNIYEVDHGLDCKVSEYAVELREEYFSLQVDEIGLKVINRKEGDINEVPPGEWCIDRDYAGQNLVARVCSRDCSKYGAYCIKKCCPIGQHFRPRRCGSYISSCAPNKDDVLFDVTDYLEPLQRDYKGIADVLGFSSGLLCPAGRVVLNKSIERDHHHLDRTGRLVSPVSVGHDYCFEAFDMRRCDGSIPITAVNCFIKSPQTKDFQISFIMICVSIVCLALTLLVYLSLPELRNLHGRTLISHATMMLLAYSCLGRVQYNMVPDNTVCTLLGYGIYFGFVSAFFWLNVMCFDIWWTFGSVRTVQPMRKAGAELRRFLWYSLYAWSGSILLTLIMYLFDKYPVSVYLDANIGEGMCWFGAFQNTKSDWPHYIFFVIPMGLITFVNFVLWVLTARHCARVKAEVHRLQAGSVGDRAKRRFRIDRAKYVLTGKLWVVMGAGWISELLSTLTNEPPWLWAVVDLINELQGVFIFVILVMKPKLYYLIRKRLGCSRIPLDTSIY